MIDLIELSGALLVIGLGTWELSQGALTLGGLLVFLTFLTQLYSPVRGMSRLVNRIYAASAAAERIIEFLDEQPSVADRPEPRRRSGARRGAVELDQRHASAIRRPSATRVSRRLALGSSPARCWRWSGRAAPASRRVAKLLLRFYDPARRPRSCSTGRICAI